MGGIFESNHNSKKCDLIFIKNDSPKSDSPKSDSPKSDSPKSDSSKSDSRNNEFSTINDIKIKNNQRKNDLSMLSNVRISNRYCNKIDIRNSTVHNKNIKLYGKEYLLYYIKNNINYDVFVCEIWGDGLMCYGIMDSNIRCTDILDYKDIPIKYKYNNINLLITLYAKKSNIIIFPIYFCITTLNFECNIEQFINMFEDIIHISISEF